MAITKQEVDMLHKLTITLNKIKRGSTVADNMETFTYFLERMQRRDPELAEMVAPHVEEYISARRSKDEHDFLLDGFTETGHLPHSNNDAEERLLDEMEAESLNTHDHTRTETSHAHNPPPPQPRSTATTSPLRSEQVKQQASSNSNPRPQPVRHHEPIRPVHTPLKPNSTGHRQLVNATAKAA
jgi:hypothetical protein